MAREGALPRTETTPPARPTGAARRDPIPPPRLGGARPAVILLAAALLPSGPAIGDEPAPVRMEEAELSIHGNDGLWTWSLKRFLSAYDDEEISEGLLADIALDLETYYRSEGFPFVSVKVRARERRGRIRVSVWIQEGPQVAVEEVRFEGLSAVPEEEIRGLISTRAWSFLSPSYFVRTEVEMDARRIADRIRMEGHIHCKVEGEVDVRKDRGRANVTFRIDEGIRIGIVEVRFPGHREVTREALLRAIGFRRGDPYSPRRMEERKWAIEDLYADRGYVNVQVIPEATGIDEDRGEAQVAFRIEEGERSRVAEIRFEGHKVTSDALLRDQLTFRKGDWFSRGEVRATTERLYRLGVFEFVRHEVKGIGPMRVEVLFRLRERKAGQARLGIGYGSFEGMRGIVGVSYSNLFGRAKRGEAEVRVSGVGHRSMLRYVDPSILRGKWKGAAEIFYEDREDPNFDILRFGGSVTGTHPIIERLDFSLRGRLEASKVSDLATGLVSPDRSVDLRSLSFILTWNSRDVGANPSSGLFLRAGLESAGGFLGGDGNFEKLTTSGAVYATLYPDWVVIALSARAGWIFPHDRNEMMPIQEQFFTGGEGTLRGFREKEILPVDSLGLPIGGGGNSLLVLNAEIRCRIWGNLWGAVFWDAGNVWFGADDLDPTDLRHSPGLGIRYVTPIGPIRLDWGHKIRREEGERPWEIHLSVGFAF